MRHGKQRRACIKAKTCPGYFGKFSAGYIFLLKHMHFKTFSGKSYSRCEPAYSGACYTHLFHCANNRKMGLIV
jgi:hypothetical protein